MPSARRGGNHVVDLVNRKKHRKINTLQVVPWKKLTNSRPTAPEPTHPASPPQTELRKKRLERKPERAKAQPSMNASLVSTNESFMSTNAALIRTNASLMRTNASFVHTSQLTPAESHSPFIRTNASFASTNESFMLISANDPHSNRYAPPANRLQPNPSRINHAVFVLIK
jgi:hypothetical protein